MHIQHPLSLSLIADRFLLGTGSHVLKFGWARVNFNYFMDDAEFTFVIDAIKQIADHGWKLLSSYKCDATVGPVFTDTRLVLNHLARLGPTTQPPNRVI